MMRRKLGFGPPELGEFRITISTRDLAQLDTAFERGVPRTGEIESFHTAALQIQLGVTLAPAAGALFVVGQRFDLARLSRPRGMCGPLGAVRIGSR
jgi:hypothetical protein